MLHCNSLSVFLFISLLTSSLLPSTALLVHAVSKHWLLQLSSQVLWKAFNYNDPTTLLSISKLLSSPDYCLAQEYLPQCATFTPKIINTILKQPKSVITAMLTLDCLKKLKFLKNPEAKKLIDQIVESNDSLLLDGKDSDTHISSTYLFERLIDRSINSPKFSTTQAICKTIKRQFSKLDWKAIPDSWMLFDSTFLLYIASRARTPGISLVLQLVMNLPNLETDVLKSWEDDLGSAFDFIDRLVFLLIQIKSMLIYADSLKTDISLQEFWTCIIFISGILGEKCCSGGMLTSRTALIGTLVLLLTELANIIGEEKPSSKFLSATTLPLEMWFFGMDEADYYFLTCIKQLESTAQADKSINFLLITTLLNQAYKMSSWERAYVYFLASYGHKVSQRTLLSHLLIFSDSVPDSQIVREINNELLVRAAHPPYDKYLRNFYFTRTSYPNNLKSSWIRQQFIKPAYANFCPDTTKITFQDKFKHTVKITQWLWIDMVPRTTTLCGGCVDGRRARLEAGQKLLQCLKYIIKNFCIEKKGERIDGKPVYIGSILMHFDVRLALACGIIRAFAMKLILPFVLDTDWFSYVIGVHPNLSLTELVQRLTQKYVKYELHLARENKTHYLSRISPLLCYRVIGMNVVYPSLSAYYSQLNLLTCDIFDPNHQDDVTVFFANSYFRPNIAILKELANQFENLQELLTYHH